MGSRSVLGTSLQRPLCPHPEYVQGNVGGARAVAHRRRLGRHVGAPDGTPPATMSAVNAEHPRLVTRIGAAMLHVRWFVRAPIWLYRARLGFVMGTRLLMLEHVGRTSGLRRYVVLEIVDHPVPGRYVVVSGFGHRAQWFRNVAANPQVRIFLGSHAPASAVAQRLDPDDSAASLHRYANAHPRSWAKLRPILEATLGAHIDEEPPELPVIAFDLPLPARGSGR